MMEHRLGDKCKLMRWLASCDSSRAETSLRTGHTRKGASGSSRTRPLSNKVGQKKRRLKVYTLQNIQMEEHESANASGAGLNPREWRLPQRQRSSSAAGKAPAAPNAPHGAKGVPGQKKRHLPRSTDRERSR